MVVMSHLAYISLVDRVIYVTLLKTCQNPPKEKEIGRQKQRKFLSLTYICLFTSAICVVDLRFFF